MITDNQGPLFDGHIPLRRKILSYKSNLVIDLVLEEVLVFLSYINNRPIITIVCLSFFVLIIYLICSFYSSSNIQWAFSSLLQAEATFIALLVTGGIFISTVGREALKKETEYNMKLQTITMKYLNGIVEIRKKIQEKFTITENEMYNKKNWQRFYDISLIEYALSPYARVDEINPYIPDFAAFNGAAVQMREDTGTLIYSLEGFNSYKTVKDFNKELKAFNNNKDYNYLFDKYAFSSFLGKRFYRVLLSFSISFVLLSLGLIINHLSVPVPLGNQTIDVIPVICGFFISFSIFAFLLLVRFMVKLFTNFRVY